MHSHENGSSPHGREGRGEQSSLAFKGTCTETGRCEQSCFDIGQFGHFHIRGVLTFVASSLDINGCVLSYFQGTANLHCYTSCTLTTLHCNKVSFLQCCHMKRYNKIFTKMWEVYSLLWDTVYIYIYIHTYTLLYI